jgi:SAM-dependent methyltransferase
MSDSAARTDPAGALDRPQRGRTASPGTTFHDRAYNRLRAWLAPDLRNSQLEYLDELRAADHTSTRWLDLGCGHNVVAEWIDLGAAPLRPLAGIDLDLAALRMNDHVRWRALASGEALPFTAGSFDLVTANMVLEHVAEPERLFREVARVLVPGGRFLIHTPNVHGYTTAATRLVPEALLAPLAFLLHRRQSEDVYPTHYRANSVAALHGLAEQCGFVVSQLRYVQSSPQFVRMLPLLVPEMVLISALRARVLERARPCLLATLERRPAA